ncbi:hypothetical protein GE09DRAFT_1183367 [Coniochaeta sp. 2T2.1]|nr:hypothetical protein GE09DRAFT_1183367 [Coniochaeta sp. 2T2.1]
MGAPLLAPRLPARPIVSVPLPEPVTAHSDSEWRALYPEIERLYVRERRKLRYVMQYMEREYGFKATLQMYKKRFTKWGFQKNTKRSLDKRAECTKVVKRKARHGELASLPAAPDFAEDDRLMLMILTNVRTWSTAFFESTQFMELTTSIIQQIPTESQLRQFKTKEANFAFKLVVDLLDRGHGALAGRMARKAFLLAEDMLTLEGPALVWNLLEMMHYVVTGHAQLFQMLLRHLIALAHDRMRGAHPFIAMLRSLQKLVASITSSISASSRSSSSSSSSSTDGDSSPSIIDSRLQSSNLPHLLKQAWVVNAEMLLHNFDPRLFPLYFRILYPTWDTCAIPAPARLVGAAKQWFCLLEAEHLMNVAPVGQTVGHHAVRLLAYTLPKEDEMLESLLTPLSKTLMDDSPQIYDMLRVNSLAAVKEGRHSLADKKHTLDIDSSVSLRMLAVLATAKILESSSPSSCQARTDLCARRYPAANVTPLDPAPVASAIRTLIQLDGSEDVAGLVPCAGAVERIRAVVTLREFAEGETDPQVVREMWLLQDALAQAGRVEEAEGVERDAYRRMERYIEDIPVDSA